MSKKKPKLPDVSFKGDADMIQQALVLMESLQRQYPRNIDLAGVMCCALVAVWYEDHEHAEGLVSLVRQFWASLSETVRGKEQTTH